MIPIWLVVVIAGIAFWLGFFACALLMIGRDAPKPMDVDTAVHQHMRDMEIGK